METKEIDGIGTHVFKVISRMLNARYSLPTWILVVMSIMTGITIGVIAISDPPSATIFLEALPFDGLVWGPLLAASGVTAVVGMIKHKNKIVRIGAFASFCLWVFGTFAFATASILNVLFLPIPMLVFWSYKYLASFVREENHHL